MASIASLVPKARPTLISALFLAVSVLALQDGHGPRHCGRAHLTVASLQSTLLRAPQTLDWSVPPPELDPWNRPAPLTRVIRPLEHPDAQPWPHGMVIGPPAIDLEIVVREASLVDSLLSAFFTVLGTFET